MFPYLHEISKLAKTNDFTITHNQLGLFNIEYKNPNGGESIKKVEMERAEFGNIEYSSAPEEGEFTVSFGDLYSYPFCTCSHWQTYKLPCVHMFAIFQSIPEWKYDMLSPLYRYSNTVTLDYSCFTSGRSSDGMDKQCQANLESESIGIQIEEENIFISASDTKVNTVMMRECKELLKQINKLSFIFNSKFLLHNIQEQLQSLLDEFQVSLSNNGNIVSLDHLLSLIKKPVKGKQTSKNVVISDIDLNKIVPPENSKKDNLQNENKKQNSVNGHRKENNAMTSSASTVTSSSLTEIDSKCVCIRTVSPNKTISVIKVNSSENLSAVVQSLSRTNASVRCVSNCLKTRESIKNLSKNMDSGEGSVKVNTSFNPTNTGTTCNQIKWSIEDVIPIIFERSPSRKEQNNTGLQTTEEVEVSIEDGTQSRKRINKVSVLNYLPLLKKKCFPNSIATVPVCTPPAETAKILDQCVPGFSKVCCKETNKENVYSNLSKDINTETSDLSKDVNIETSDLSTDGNIETSQLSTNGNIETSELSTNGNIETSELSLNEYIETTELSKEENIEISDFSKDENIETTELSTDEKIETSGLASNAKTKCTNMDINISSEVMSSELVQSLVTV